MPWFVWIFVVILVALGPTMVVVAVNMLRTASQAKTWPTATAVIERSEMSITHEIDTDEDGWMICELDCNDMDDTIYPWAEEICDGADNDCDFYTDEDFTDLDGDCYAFCVDCDEDNPDVNPGHSFFFRWCAAGHYSPPSLYEIPKR